MYESLKESWLVQELMQEACEQVRQEEQLKLQEAHEEGKLKLQEAREEAREEGELKLKEVELKLQEVRKEVEVELKAREAQAEHIAREQQQHLQEWRAFLLSFVEERFPNPKLLRQAKGQAAIIDDAKILQNLILKVGLAQTVGEVEHYLLDWSDTSGEQD